MRREDVLTVLDALERAGVRYAVFGGVAMAAHGFDRATRDRDDAQRLARAFGFGSGEDR